MDHEAVFSRLSEKCRGHPFPIAAEPGVFAVFIERRESLPGIDVPETGILYIGQAADLSKRNISLSCRATCRSAVRGGPWARFSGIGWASWHDPAA